MRLTRPGARPRLVAAGPRGPLPACLSATGAEPLVQEGGVALAQRVDQAGVGAGRVLPHRVEPAPAPPALAVHPEYAEAGLVAAPLVVVGQRPVPVTGDRKPGPDGGHHGTQ